MLAEALLSYLQGLKARFVVLDDALLGELKEWNITHSSVPLTKRTPVSEYCTAYSKVMTVLTRDAAAAAGQVAVVSVYEEEKAGKGAESLKWTLSVAPIQDLGGESC